ncbi:MULTISPECIES: hypothetical protein [Streptomyces]|uniref:Uncharacterized protein n=1 Tax=Streptomyces fimbriatus TaxID=68197 RepID=A0ABW0D2A4_STRFI
METAAGCTVRESGWALAGDRTPPAAETGPHWAVVRRHDGLTSALVGLLGRTELPGGAGGPVLRAEGHNACGHHSATPGLTAHLPGSTRLLAGLVLLSGDPAAQGDTHALCRGTAVRPKPDGTVDVHFPDGSVEHVDTHRFAPAVPGSPSRPAPFAQGTTTL